jgi:hypothetical protein
MKPICIIIMDNIMGPKPEEVLKIYDLKGSTFQRINEKVKGPLTVLKDNNFINNQTDRVFVQDKLRRDLLRRIEADKNFLKANFLMDYSMLIYFLKKTEFKDDESQFTSSRNMKMSIVIKKGADG